VIVTGGLGGTHDDVTADALADAFDRELVVEPAISEGVIEPVATAAGQVPVTDADEPGEGLAGAVQGACRGRRDRRRTVEI